MVQRMDQQIVLLLFFSVLHLFLSPLQPLFMVFLLYFDHLDLFNLLVNLLILHPQFLRFLYQPLLDLSFILRQLFLPNFPPLNLSFILRDRFLPNFPHLNLSFILQDRFLHLNFILRPLFLLL